MEEKKKLNAIENQDDLEVGEILRRTRVHYGQSLRDVENILRIRQSQIDAIEKGEIHKLPGRVYAIGFVRSYAEYLGLDGAKVVQLFKAQYMDRQPRETLTFPVPASESKTPPFWLAFVGVVFLLMVFGTWGYLQNLERTNASVIAPVPEEVKESITRNAVPPAPKSEEPLKQETSVSEAVSSGPANEQHKGIILNLKDSSWVEIKDGSGKILVSNVLKKGDQYFVPDSPGLSISLGNAGGVELVLNGRTLKPLGKEGDVLRDIPLDTAYLKTLEFESVDEQKNVKKPPVREN